MRVRLPTFSDPGRFAAKAALRAAIVIPAVFAFAVLVIDDPETSTYAAFGSFAMLVLADFGGRPRARLAAFAGLGLVGAVLIVVGTLCSRDPWLAAAAMGVVAFVVLFSGVLHGYLAAGGVAAMLTFILPVTLAAPASVIPARLEGWALAVAAGTAAQLLLWPGRPRDAVRAGVVDACRKLAAAIDAIMARDREHAAAARDAATGAVTEVQRRFLAMPYRPTGPTGPTEAVAFLVDELDWLRSFLPRADAAVAADRDVLAAVSDALRGSAATLEGGAERPDLARLDAVRDALAQRLVVRLEAAPPGPGDDAVRGEVGRAFRTFALSRSARQLGRNALVAARVPGGRDPVTLRAITTQRAVEHAGPRSVWFRNSVRSALALAAAVFVAQEVELQHAFWIVLGTLSVLRSNVLSTGATILGALAGTAVGIVLGSAVILAIGTDTTILWFALPPAVLLAAYAPRAISFAAGQAGFTLVLLILFNLIAPVGWEVGLLRVEDVAIGFAISVAFGALFWPRGAASLLRESLGSAYTTAITAVDAALARVAGGADRARAAGALVSADAAAHRLDDAVRQYLAERPIARLGLADVAPLIAGVTRLRRTTLALAGLLRMTEGAPSPPRGLLDDDRRALRDWYGELAAALTEGSGTAPPPVRPPDRAAAAVAVAREAISASDDGATRAAFGVLWAGEHVENLLRLGEHLVAPADALAGRPLAHGPSIPRARAGAAQPAAMERAVG